MTSRFWASAASLNDNPQSSAVFQVEWVGQDKLVMSVCCKKFWNSAKQNGKCIFRTMSIFQGGSQSEDILIKYLHLNWEKEEILRLLKLNLVLYIYCAEIEMQPFSSHACSRQGWARLKSQDWKYIRFFNTGTQNPSHCLLPPSLAISCTLHLDTTKI